MSKQGKDKPMGANVRDRKERRQHTMATIDLETLGITREDLQERIVNKVASALLTQEQFDEDGESFTDDSEFAERLRAHVTERVNETVAAMAEKHVLPNVAEYIDTLVLQQTNRWGERVGSPVTFIEYLVQRADAYMREEVDYQGRPKGTDSFSWRKSGTRIEYMIDQHLQYHISTAMTEAFKTANASIADGLKKAVEIKIDEIRNSIKVGVKVGG